MFIIMQPVAALLILAVYCFVYTFYLHFVLTHLLVSKLLLAKDIVPVFFCVCVFWGSSFPWSNAQY